MCEPAPGVADEVALSTFVRTDGDGTTVVSPRLLGRANVVDDTTFVEVGYAADVWTSASIDVRTSATRRISEQRDELTTAVRKDIGEVALRGAYRFSIEPDYQSHGGSLGFTEQLGEGSTILEAQLSAASDTVGRAGDEAFERSLATLGARLGVTQTIDDATIAQLTSEIARREGFQSSPYRYVGVGGDGSCAGTATLCLPEAHPSSRIVSASTLRARRALGDAFSIGVDYRFYIDDWGLIAHTIGADVAWLHDDAGTLTLRYRFYGQGSADFYRERYEDPSAQYPLLSRDRELSSMTTHRGAIGYERAFDLASAGPRARIGLTAAASLLSYDEFVGLDRVVAVDFSFTAAVEL